MVKKNVTLDIFEESVLPMLQQKHTDIIVLQKTINDDYAITEPAQDGKQIPVRYTVSQPAVKAIDPAIEEAAIQKRIDEAVAKEIANGKKAGPKAANGDDKKIIVPAECKKFGAVKNITGIKNGMDAEERAYSIGMWAMGCLGNENAKTWCEGRGITFKVQSENVNTSGGYSVPDILSTDFIELKEQYGVARRLAGRYPMTADTLKINRRVSGLTAYFVAENSAGTESTMGLDQVMLVAKDMLAIARMSNQLNADSVMNWGDRLAYEIAYAFSYKEDLCAFNGDGTSTYGGITGLANAYSKAGWTAGVPGTGLGLIKQGTSTAWSSMVMGDFTAVVGALPQYADSPNCGWIANRTFYYNVMERLVQAQGGVTIMETRQSMPGYGPRPLFLGYPVNFSQVLPNTSTSAQINAYFGDMSLAVAFGDRAQDSIAFSTEAYVNGQSLWERNQLGVRGIERVDINVHDVGDGSSKAGPLIAFANG